jgi:hypothetical protein
MKVAQIILNQIKMLDRRALMAWGAKEFVAMNDGLKFKSSGLVRWKGYVYVHYNEGTDLYDIEFAQIRKMQWNRKKMIEGVFVEDLVRIIDEQVG